jgi:hypothetical protein
LPAEPPSGSVCWCIAGIDLGNLAEQHGRLQDAADRSPGHGSRSTDAEGNLIREIQVGKNGHRTIVTGDGAALFDFMDWLMFSEPKRDLRNCPVAVTKIGFEFS